MKQKKLMKSNSKDAYSFKYNMETLKVKVRQQSKVVVGWNSKNRNGLFFIRFSCIILRMLASYNPCLIKFCSQ